MNFEEAVEKIKTIKDGLSDKEKGVIYGLYKQATIGDINIARPFFINMVECAKWDAWKKQEGQTKEQATQQYVKKVKKYLEKYSTK